ncbi:hypothetical protein O1611_g6353 [Lasiodiplodia mahajangana]|uniref:Uncharacterized protein n=1 Tax=Lasiodiplodia mahajangana TaxID=1108764 RepID=A0ACC2JJB7_9PEZI|nr:hypothetical protein O1611_g6353 [Lasiodiplodia mahajangana]
MVEPPIEPPSRIFIACARCKARKRKCDGSTPKCSNCAANNTECNYAAVRRTRGPGKKDKRTEAQENETDELCNPSNTPEFPNLGAVDAADPGSSCGGLTNEVSSTDSSSTRPHNKKPLSIFPYFLLSNTFAQDISTFKSEVLEATARGGFSPLMPRHITTQLIKHSFEEIMPEPHIISFKSFMQLLEAQYDDNTVPPGHDVGRWAVVNGVIALAGRSKVAPGSEDDLAPIHLGFYRNAKLVLPQLIAQNPGLLSIQAILVMAMFARGIPDAEAFTMLMRNASHQLETLEHTWSLMTPPLSLWQREEFIRVYKFANQLSQETYQLATQQGA